MSVSPASAVGASTDSDASRIPVRTLGQDDFLKLIVAQLTSQDPLNPQKDTEFIAQLAQFSQLEQAKSMETDMAGMRSDQAFLQASAMLGRSVELQDAQGNVTRGTVSSIQLASGTPMIVVNGQAHYLDEVVSVSPATADPVTPPGGNATPPVTVAPPVAPPATINPVPPPVTLNP